MKFTHNKAIIGMPETPYLLRVNKQVDCFSIGNIEPGNIESLNTYGRGKFLEFAIAACDTSLYGRIGKVKDDQQYTFISAVITNSDDYRLSKGLLVHFLSMVMRRGFSQCWSQKSKLPQFRPNPSD